MTKETKKYTKEKRKEKNPPTKATTLRALSK